jgi:two-component system OmpR family response regulator/two-component system alkaline phosphatase synthesis response regulator PhoP
LDNRTQKILVVDDNEDIRNLLTLILEKEGFSVFQGVDGRDGLEEISRHQPDLILLDVMMPGMSGLEVLSEVRKSSNKEISSILVCMLTAKSLVEDIDEALELGATSYIIKPFRPAQLVEKVNTLLNSLILR